MSDNPIADAMKVIGEAIGTDESYAMGWKSNIAAACADSMPSGIPEAARFRMGRDAADRFIKLAFGVDTTKLLL
jgi:hypothetical protein